MLDFAALQLQPREVQLAASLLPNVTHDACTVIRVGLWDRPTGRPASFYRMDLMYCATEAHALQRVRERVLESCLLGGDKAYILNCLDLGNFSVTHESRER